MLSTMAQRADDAREQEGPCDKRNESYLQELSVAPSRIFSEDRHLDPDDVRFLISPGEPVEAYACARHAPMFGCSVRKSHRSYYRRSCAQAEIYERDLGVRR